jgi:hypothetical protein
MIIDETLLWSKLESYSPDNPHDALTFSQRLARENGWPPFFTERVVTEYKKFLFLCMISPHPVTPSDEVDQAWHLHLVYTKSYWNDLCKNILGKDLHHTPTEGGPAERDKFTSYYESTLALYHDKFGHAPPDDIWPPSDKRFGDADFVRANTQTHWLVPKKSWHKGISGLLLIFVGALAYVISSNIGFLVIFVASGLIVWLQETQSGLRRGHNTSNGCGGGGGCGGDSGCSGDGGCSSGCSGCGGGCGGGGD